MRPLVGSYMIIYPEREREFLFPLVIAGGSGHKGFGKGLGGMVREKGRWAGTQEKSLLLPPVPQAPF